MNTLDTHRTIVNSSARLGLALCALLMGCTDPDELSGISMGDDTTSDSADDGGAADETGGQDGDGSGGGSDGADDESGGDPPAGVCGDGIPDAGEDCDDGINDGSYGGCNADCTLAPYCGDALRNGVDETCDDGNADSSDGCLADCSIPEGCEAIKGFDQSAPDGLYVVDPDGEGGEEAIQVFCDMSSLISEWGEPQSVPDSFGWETAGADVVAGAVGAGARPDIVLMHVDDPIGGNRAYYQIGWDLDEAGDPTLGWSERNEIPGDFGTDGTGAGLSLADIDGNGSPELVVTHIESVFLGGNRGYYRIGWNLDSQGQVTGGWSDRVQMPNDFGGDTAEAGATMLDLDGDGAQDLITFHVREEFGRDEGYYQIGWDFDESGEAAVWSDMMLIPGDFDDSAAGLTAVRSAPDAAPSLLVFHVSGGNGYLRVGRLLDEAGHASGGWSDPMQLEGSWGGGSRYGGVSSTDLDADGSMDLVFFHIDNDLFDNPGRYQWGKTL